MNPAASNQQTTKTGKKFQNSLEWQAQFLTVEHPQP